MAIKLYSTIAGFVFCFNLNSEREKKTHTQITVGYGRFIIIEIDAAKEGIQRSAHY